MKRQTVRFERATRIENDLVEAFARLREGKPCHKRLRADAKNGMLRVNITNVAREAGHSRTLIGFTGCRYSALRKEILAYRPGSQGKHASSHRGITLRQQIEELRKHLDAALAEAISHLHAREKAERKARRWQEDFKRLQHAKAGGTLTSGNVVDIATKKPV